MAGGQLLSLRGEQLACRRGSLLAVRASLVRAPPANRWFSPCVLGAARGSRGHCLTVPYAAAVEERDGVRGGDGAAGESFAANIVPLPPSLGQPAVSAAIAGEALSGDWDAAAVAAALAAEPALPSLATVSLAAVGMAALTEAPPSVAPESSGAEELVDGHMDGVVGISQDEIDQAVHIAFEHEIENINLAVHEAFEQEMETLNQTVEQAVETALLDRSFDIKANFNTMIALTGVILYWRGIWNLFDTLLGTDNLVSNLASIGVGLSVILLFRIFKLPLAEFW